MNPDHNNDPITSNSLGDTTGADDILSSLVGEGKKFKTPVDLARGKLEADSFIEKLKEENNALRALIRNADESKRSTEVMQDLLNRVSQSTLGRTTSEGEPKPTEQSTGQSNQSQSLTSRDVELVYKQMRQREREDANESTAMQKLTASYGDQTETFLSKKAAELALDVGVLKAMARQSPIAFLNLIGENNNRNSASTNNASIKSSVNSAAVAELSGDSGVRNKKYYDKLKKDMGVKAFVMNRNLQVQMHKDMQALADAFDAA